MKTVKVEVVKDFIEYENFISENPHIELVNVIDINGTTCVTYREEESIENEYLGTDYQYIEEDMRDRHIFRREYDTEVELIEWLRKESDIVFRWQHIYRENGKIVIIYV